MKSLLITLLSSTLFLSASDKKMVVEPEDRVVSFKKPEFITKYKELVDNKAAKKALDTQKPLKYLSPDLFEKWKRASTLLFEDVDADATFQVYDNPMDKNKNLVFYANELKNQITLLSKQASIIMEQYPIFTYKKPLFKSEPKYKEGEIDSARTALKKSSQALVKIENTVKRITVGINGILSKIPTTQKTDRKTGESKTVKTITVAQEELYKQAADFSDKVTNLTIFLEAEINAIP
jgi:hypothetical protein